jgi:hypothetical protein
VRRQRLQLLCDPSFRDQAFTFFERGNGGLYGEPVMRAVPDEVVHHFVDTLYDSSSGGFYPDYNKGELQHTYLLLSP